MKPAAPFFRALALFATAVLTPACAAASAPQAADANSAEVAVAPADYGVDGPFAVSATTLAVTGGSGDFSVDAYLPIANSPRPVVVFSPGLQQPAAAYAVYGHRLASYGIACFIRDDPGVAVLTPDVVSDIAYFLTSWLPAQPIGLKGQLDLTKVGVCGHSRGGKASLIAAEVPLLGKVRGWFGLDPVDASFNDADVQGRDKIGDVGVPIAMLGAEVSGACSPAEDNYAMLFGFSKSPAVALTAIGAGHTHFEQQDQCVMCGMCTPDGPADKAVVLALAVRYVTAFFARELLADTHVGADFSGAGATQDLAAGTVTRVAK